MQEQRGSQLKQFGSFELDTVNERLSRNGNPIPLPPKPFAVLRYLVEHPGRLITHDELLEALWPHTYVQPQVLRTYMLDLRKALGDDPGQPRFIQTLPKRGYCFVAPVLDSSSGSVAKGSSSAGVEHPARPTSIVGRGEELNRLATYVSLLKQGQRQMVLISGEAGIGKTALVEAFCERYKSSDSLLVAHGQCVEGFGAKENYYPLIEALSQLCASPDGEHACRILAKMSTGWQTAMNAGKTINSTRDEAGTEPECRPGDLCAGLEELAKERPLIVVLEDLNWADDATLHCLSALARRRSPAKLMVIATCRLHVSTGQAFKTVRQDLVMHRLCTEIALQPLEKTAMRALLSRELEQEELPSGLTSFIHQHSEGNPLFAMALLEHLIALRFLIRDVTGDAAGTAGLWKQRAPFQKMEAGIPQGLAQMIDLEIGRLDPREQRLLEAGSLVGIAFPVWAVAAALEEDEAATEEACDALAAHLHFLQPAGQDELPGGTRSGFYVFAHGLYREVLYERQTASRRARRHIRIAKRLEQLFTGREASVAREVAFHYEAAAAWTEAVKALRASARHALQRDAMAEAADLLEHALRLAENLENHEREVAVHALNDDLRAIRIALSTVKSCLDQDQKSLTDSGREVDTFIFADR